jgi:hypothetical protein
VEDGNTVFFHRKKRRAKKGSERELDRREEGGGEVDGKVEKGGFEEQLVGVSKEESLNDLGEKAEGD